MRKRVSGNVLFLILIAVALFAALSYAVTNTMRSGSVSTDAEQARIDQAVVDNYTAALNVGKLRLEMAGCSSINYSPPAKQSVGDKSCHMFHPQGGNVAYQNLEGLCFSTGAVENLEIGERCGGFIVYAGMSGGSRIYAMSFDLGIYQWNNGSSNWTISGATSSSDGLANTNTLVSLSDAGTPYQAAEACRSLGADWYLPARDEIILLYTNRDAIGGFNETGTFPNAVYWSSNERSNQNAEVRYFHTGGSGQNRKSSAYNVRCVRR